MNQQPVLRKDILRQFTGRSTAWTFGYDKHRRYWFPHVRWVTKFNNGVGDRKNTQTTDHAIYHTKTYCRTPSVESLRWITRRHTSKGICLGIFECNCEHLTIKCTPTIGIRKCPKGSKPWILGRFCMAKVSPSVSAGSPLRPGVTRQLWLPGNFPTVPRNIVTSLWAGLRSLYGVLVRIIPELTSRVCAAMNWSLLPLHIYPEQYRGSKLPADGWYPRN